MDYIKSFEKRYQKYLYAVNKYPRVMENEFKIACEMMRIEDDNVVLNIPCAGTELKRYILNKNIRYHEFETSPDFASMGYNLCSYDNIPLEDKSVDRIIVLTSFHHVPVEERPKIYNEFKRILKNDGLFVIGDVIKNSKQDKWLNEFVNEWNSKGHKGIFFDMDDKKMLEDCGFIVDVYNKKYKWSFNNEEEMKDFIINLFGLDLFHKDDLITYLKEFLNYHDYGFDWELIYFISKISQDHIQFL